MSGQHPPLAIVGMSCRLPGGVNNPDTYWDLLINGRSGITDVPLNRWDWRNYYHPNNEIPGRMVTKWGGFIEHYDQFDARFFGISPREAQTMDPQQRWLLETTWEAFEDAGIAPSTLRGSRVGVFAGLSSHDYTDAQQGDTSLIDIHTASGNALSIAANRISYFFDFKGPSMAIDTACSSALVATYLACQSIWSGQCTMSLAGGANALLNPSLSIGFSKASMLSPSGQCFAFDARANGYVRGEGVGVVIIKPFDQALTDGDRIYALIRAAVVNQDGHTSSLTVPDLAAQKTMLYEAYQEAGIDPKQVAYVEAHGTGTPVGDPIEAQALGHILGAHRSDGTACLLGSVKTNIGHLEAASGIAGLIKGALILHHNLIPPQLNFEKANPHISLAELGLRVVTACQPLPRLDDQPAIVGVNSFGFGGTNAHIVLEQAPKPDPVAAPAGTEAWRHYLLPISGRNEAALQAQIEAYQMVLADETTPINELTALAGLRREHLEQRLVVIGQDTAELQTCLRDALNGTTGNPTIVTGHRVAHPVAPVFVFTGQGAQWQGMGQRLMACEPLFRQTLEKIDALLKPLTHWSLITEMSRPRHESQIDRTDIAQPAIFALQVALAEMWAAWGITPAKVIGHSVGEVAAAYVAGIYSLEDAINIIYHRSRLQHTTAGQGTMVAVGLSMAEARQAINGYQGKVQIAANNSPRLVTLTGAAAPVEAIAKDLETAGKFVHYLPIQYAFHSHQMDPIRDDLLAALVDIQPETGHIPLISSVTGELISGQTMDAGYWWDNVRQPVRFAAAVTGLIWAGHNAFLEIGPHPALHHAIGDCLVDQNRTGHLFHSLRREADDLLEMLSNLAALHVYGLELNWRAINPSSGRFVDLPRYPWQWQTCWIESEARRRQDLTPFDHPLLGRRLPAPSPTWQLQLDPRVLDYLQDHRIWNGLVFPAAGFSEMGLAIAHLLFPDEPYVVENLQIKKALFISLTHLPTVQVVFDPTDKTFTIYSATGEKTNWQIHALGQLRKLPPRPTSRVMITDIQARLAFFADKEAYYRAYQAMGYQFGPSFQHIQNVWNAPGSALAEINAIGPVREQLADYHFHPALLDACFQAVTAAGAIAGVTGGEEVPYLPAAFGRIRLLGQPLPGTLWVQATITAHDHQAIMADFHVYDNAGQQVAEIKDGRFDRIQLKADRSPDAADHFYQFRWESNLLKGVQIRDVAEVAGPTNTTNFDSGLPSTLMSTAPDLEEATPRKRSNETTVLLLADRQGVTTALAEALTQTGAQVYLAMAGASFQAYDHNRYTIDSSSEADLSRLLLEVRDNPAPLTAIVHAWGLDHPFVDQLSAEALVATQETTVLHALRLAHVLAARTFKKPPQVTFLGRGIQAVIEGDRCDALANAPLMGFMRVANNEYSAFRWRLIDLDPQRPAFEIDDLVQELTLADDELEIAYRQGHRYANRLQQIKLDTLSPLRREAVQPNGDVLPYRLQFDRPGFLTSLSLNETTRRPPGPDEVEIQVQTAGLNFRDVMKVLGLYPGRPIDLTWLGDDVAGRVVAVGEGVTDLKPGEAAVGLAPYAFRSHVTVKRRAVFKKPSHLSFEEAATLPTVFLTAYYALVHLARLQPGERVLIHAGSGGVGQAAIQIAQDLGLEIFATAGTPEKRAFLRDQGIQHVFDSRSLDFADDVMRVTQGRGVDAVLNSLAGDFIPKNISVLAPFGRYLEIGKVDIYNNSKIGLEPLRNNISVFIIDLAQLMEHKPADFATILEVLRLKFEQKVYRALPHTVFPITQALEAFRYMAAGKHIGKNVLSFQADEIPVGRITEEGQLFRSGASYLISGGAGGFGLEVAKWMARQGARHLVLLTRSGPPDDAARADIEQLRSAGIDVVDARGDVTRPADVERVVQAIQMRSAPLAGVIHSAMVLNDDLIVDLDEIGFNRAFLPKLVGAWNLHQATLDIALDVFICFSSISSMVGTIKQANYSAGNAFLDTLAHYRRARGLSALTINWGALSGAGFVARNQDTARYLETTGLSPLPVVEALQTLRDILPLDGTQLGIARINWTELSKYLGGVAHSNVFSGLTQQETAVPADSSTMTHIIAAAPPNRLPLVEQFISQAVAAVLSIDGSQIDPETSLPQLGLDSLMSIELINSVNTRLNLNLAVSDVLGGSTMRDLAVILLDKILASPHVSGSSGIDPPAERESGIWSSVFDQPDSHLDLRAEAQLDPAIVPVATALPAIVSPQAILLTGATGFLGAFLLADLLHQTEAEIYCLVRAETTEAAHQRLQANLARYGLWDGRQQARLKPIPGDLAQPRLGLSTEQFQMLAARIEAIYHNGAALNLIQPYQALKAANVLSVQEMLQLATRTRIKPVHYVSTIAIFFAANRSRQTVIRESDQPDPHELRGGYMQSKWVAEELVWQAQERGIPCSIYRPGLISGHSQTGITNTQDLTSRLVKGSYQLGLYPDRNRALNIVPVDYVSRAIVHLSRQPGIWGQVFHLTNPQPTPLKDLVHWAGSLGATLQEASYREWRTALIDQVEQGIENELLPLLPFFSSDSPQQIEQQVDCQNTLRYLAGSDIVCPPMTPSLIETYVAYLIDSGFLELSPANTSA